METHLNRYEGAKISKNYERKDEHHIISNSLNLRIDGSIFRDDLELLRENKSYAGRIKLKL